jgi:hypothetical protein
MTTPYPLPRLQNLPTTMPNDGAISINLEEGSPVFRASTVVQERIQTLLLKQRMDSLSPTEIEELDQYEEIDDYLSHLNRIVRNLL